MFTQGLKKTIFSFIKKEKNALPALFTGTLSAHGPIFRLLSLFSQLIAIFRLKYGLSRLRKFIFVRFRLRVRHGLDNLSLFQSKC